ncbi:MAG: peptidyl-prolyl cis-trans isomerase, partial [Thermoguttaceae bacterium]
ASVPVSAAPERKPAALLADSVPTTPTITTPLEPIPAPEKPAPAIPAPEKPAPEKPKMELPDVPKTIPAEIPPTIAANGNTNFPVVFPIDAAANQNSAATTKNIEQNPNYAPQNSALQNSGQIENKNIGFAQSGFATTNSNSIASLADWSDLPPGLATSGSRATNLPLQNGNVSPDLQQSTFAEQSKLVGVSGSETPLVPLSVPVFDPIPPHVSVLASEAMPVAAGEIAPTYDAFAVKMNSESMNPEKMAHDYLAGGNPLPKETASHSSPAEIAPAMNSNLPNTIAPNSKLPISSPIPNESSLSAANPMATGMISSGVNTNPPDPFAVGTLPDLYAASPNHAPMQASAPNFSSDPAYSANSTYSANSVPKSPLIADSQNQEMKNSGGTNRTTGEFPMQEKSGPASQFAISPSVLVEEVPCYGTEMVARVGTRVILMCDILPQLRRIATRILEENIKETSEEERAKITENQKQGFIESFIMAQYPALLQKQIDVALIYNDFVRSKGREDRDAIEKNFGDKFDQEEVPLLIKECGVEDVVGLKRHLKEELGSSLERERMLWIYDQIAQQWIMYSIQSAAGECTHDEMFDYYQSNKEEFSTKARVQWKELLVLTSRDKTPEESWHKIAWMGNQVIQQGAPFEEIAKSNSDGFTSSSGGFWDWTSQGNLASPELEAALFTLPVGQMSSIIKTDKGFHIVQVVKREEAKITPFIEAQVKIREKIKMQRRQKFHDEYIAELKQKHPTVVLRDSLDFKPTRNTASTSIPQTK